jgi:hypothetical protein
MPQSLCVRKLATSIALEKQGLATKPNADPGLNQRPVCPNDRETLMKIAVVAAAAALMLLPTAASATGLATCDSGPQSGWQAQDAVTKHLLKAGWREVRRMKPDGGCWEV